MACRGYIWPHMGSVMGSVQVTVSCCSLLHRVKPSHGARTTALLQLVDEHTVQALERSAIFLTICFFYFIFTMARLALDATGRASAAGWPRRRAG